MLNTNIDMLNAKLNIWMFYNWNQVSEKNVTLKTVFLLALVTGTRRGELHSLTKKSQ